nr:hypothetical transcript [Hymenolepis microstoma]
MQRISTMKLAFQEPKVDISDPPIYFLPIKEWLSKDAPSYSEVASKNLGKSLPDSHPRSNLNKPRNRGGGGRPKKSGSYAGMLTKRFGGMTLN